MQRKAAWQVDRLFERTRESAPGADNLMQREAAGQVDRLLKRTRESAPGAGNLMQREAAKQVDRLLRQTGKESAPGAGEPCAESKEPRLPAFDGGFPVPAVLVLPAPAQRTPARGESCP